ncbi:MAG: hypothetical protein JWM68_3019, partial [Verrucomicrobiales bacterium]|nr:hypothetical protein [Verrucomicrobiales bacterium]
LNGPHRRCDRLRLLNDLRSRVGRALSRRAGIVDTLEFRSAQTSRVDGHLVHTSIEEIAVMNNAMPNDQVIGGSRT